ncbi:MAG TPA: dihydrofolate reductase family protein [Acidimicrobiales bacterium]|jgi:dihydrofolate reductase|nr:dihydrofolate reductase family protein [Acidimicrobiales bacterium]
MSADGFIEDEIGSFDWTAPDDDVFAFITDLIRPISHHLYGRRLYETMAVWETDPTLAGQSDLMATFAQVWAAAEKTVFSSTLNVVATTRTSIERRFDPASIRAMKSDLDGDLMVGGANLGAQAFRAGLVDECQLFIHPLVVGGGKPSLPAGVRADFDLLDQHRFDNGVVYVRYALRTGG